MVSKLHYWLIEAYHERRMSSHYQAADVVLLSLIPLFAAELRLQQPMKTFSKS